jgi:sodium transport system ATP-binding protein
MKQKASLVISLVHDPDVIIFDEPTNGLDVITAKVVTDFLQDLRGEGKSIILSTHIFTLVEKLCDRVGVIIDGRMIVEGPLADVTGGQDLEQVFFDLYLAESKEVA